MKRAQDAMEDMRGRLEFVPRREFDSLKAEVSELRKQVERYMSHGAHQGSGAGAAAGTGTSGGTGASGPAPGATGSTGTDGYGAGGSGAGDGSPGL
jgi:hypothetical protein